MPSTAGWAAATRQAAAVKANANANEANEANAVATNNAFHHDKVQPPQICPLLHLEDQGGRKGQTPIWLPSHSASALFDGLSSRRDDANETNAEKANANFSFSFCSVDGLSSKRDDVNVCANKANADEADKADADAA